MTAKTALLSLLLIISFHFSPHLAAKTHVYLLAGQSNMMGKTQTQQLPDHYRQTPSNVRFYYQGRERKLADDAYFGPEVSFAHAVAKALPNDQHIIIKYVASGSYIEQWANTQPLFKGMIRQIELLKKHNNLPPTIDAMIWMQGESDCRSSDLANAYGHRLKQFILNTRQTLQSPNSLFIIGAVSPQNVGFPAMKQVRQKQQETHQTTANTRYVETLDLETFDNTHFNTNGLIELGKRFAKAYLSGKSK